MPTIRHRSCGFIRAGTDFIRIREERVAFYQDNWMADAKARGIDAQAAYDFYVRTVQEAAALMT